MTAAFEPNAQIVLMKGCLRPESYSEKERDARESLEGLWRAWLHDHDMIGLPLEVQATPTCSTPGEKIPALIGHLAAILQRCVALNDSQAIIPVLFQILVQTSVLVAMVIRHLLQSSFIEAHCD